MNIGEPERLVQVEPIDLPVPSPLPGLPEPVPATAPAEEEGVPA